MCHFYAIISKMFNKEDVNLSLLRKRAFNLRWATVDKGVIPLTAADPDFPCAPEIAQAITEYTKGRYLSYGPAEGLLEFRESMANYFRTKRNIPASKDLLFPVDSAAFGIWLTCKAFLTPGDESIIFDPVDFLFRYSVESVGGIAMPFAIPAGSKVDFEALEKRITTRTRLLCICNPLNPTGKVFTRAELFSFGELACKYNLTILSDEIWSDIVFTPGIFTSIASLSNEISDRTITITGFSKSYGLAGLRIGAVMTTNQKLYTQLFNASLHSSTIHGAGVLSQIAATAALNSCEYWLNDFLVHLQAMRDLCVRELNSIEGFHCIAPEGCYVAFADISGTNKTSSEIHEILLKQAKVAVVPGLKQWFGEGAENYIRISFATSEDILNDSFQRIKRIINL